MPNDGYNISGFSLQVEIPSVGCEVCNRSVFIPPGVWDGSWFPEDSIPPVTLRRIPASEFRGSRPAFTFDGCATGEETRATAIKNGWAEEELSHGVVLLVCPKCQTLIAKLASCVKYYSPTSQGEGSATVTNQERPRHRFIDSGNGKCISCGEVEGENHAR